RHEVTELARRLSTSETAVAPAAGHTVDGDVWVVYPYVDGQAPSAGLHGPGVLTRLAQAVAALHETGMVHGAISAGNVVVADDGAGRPLEEGVGGIVDADDACSTGRAHRRRSTGQEADVRALVALLTELATTDDGAGN